MNLAISDGVETILVDYFDTLVKRSCHPEVVKRKWAAILSNIWNGQINSEKLYALRLKIEAGLCRNSVSQGFDAEFRYRDMVSVLYRQLQKNKKCAPLPDAEEFMQICLELELAIELAVQQPILERVEFLRAQQKKGKKIYLVSDFYLDKDSLLYFIRHHGFEDVFSGVYVSSEKKRTKKEGGMYDDIIAELKINVKKTLMLGDNEHSDVIMSGSKGIHGWHLPTDSHFDKSDLKPGSQRHINTQRLNKIFQENSYCFNWVGGAIYLFVRRLYWRLVAQRAKNVYFFSREGEFLLQAFNRYQSLQPQGFPRIVSHYLYVSRRATYLPSLSACNASTLRKFLDQYCSCSLTIFLKSLNLDGYLDLFKNIIPGVDFDEQHVNISNLAEFTVLINHPEFIEVFHRERDKQKEYFLKYSDEIIKETCGDVVHVVDVGWKGSIQDNLAAILQRPMHGYYLGMLEGAECGQNNIKEGLLFDLQFNEYAGNPLFNEFRAGFEVFMSASHGSVKKYGENSIDFDESEAEKRIYQCYIFPFQQRALEMFKELYSIENDYLLTDEDIHKVISNNYFSGVMFPHYIERELFSSIQHYENFGGFHFSEFGVKKRSRLCYLKNFVNNPIYTLNSSWWKPLDFHAHGVGFLKYPYAALKKIKYKRFI